MFASTYLTNLHMLSTVVSADYAQCNQQPALTTFFYDSETYGLVIEASGSTGNAPKIVLTSPMGIQTTPAPSTSAGSYNLYVISPSGTTGLVGAWTVTLTAGSANLGPCALRIRAQTSLQVYPGFTASLNNDFNASQPFYSMYDYLSLILTMSPNL